MEELFIEVKGKKLDLYRAFPLTLGDWEDFEKLGILKENAINLMMSPGTMIDLLVVLLRKIDSEIVREDIRAISLATLATLTPHIDKAMEMAGAVDKPNGRGSEGGESVPFGKESST